MEEEKKVETPAPEQPSPQPATDDIAKAKGIAWLSYVGILWLVPLLSMKENAFAKFHAKQGIMMSIYYAALTLVGGILSLTIIIPILAGLAWLVLVVFGIIGIVKSAGGKYWKCPLGVGALAEKWFKF